MAIYGYFEHKVHPKLKAAFLLFE